MQTNALSERETDDDVRIRGAGALPIENQHRPKHSIRGILHLYITKNRGQSFENRTLVVHLLIGFETFD
jgi:hypothetical protein